MRLAYAVVRDDPPQVFAAENLEVLHRVLAVQVVAATPAATLASHARDHIKSALLDERWADAVTAWMQYSELAIDVYDDLYVWTEEALDRDMTPLRLQFGELFKED